MLQRSVFGMFIVLVGLVGLLGYWLFFPVATMINVNPKIRIKTPTVFSGESIVYELDFCKIRQVPASVRRELVDTMVITFPTATSNIPVGCGPHLFLQRIPAGVISGTYRLSVTVSYRLNPLRDDTYDFESDSFTIVNKAAVIQGVIP